MATMLDNIKVVANDELAKIEKSKSIKTKPMTFAGTKKYWFEKMNYDLEIENNKMVKELTEQEKAIIDKKNNSLDSMNARLLEFIVEKNPHFSDGKPIKIKSNMYQNALNNYENYIRSLSIPEETIVEEQEPMVKEIESKSLEQIQNEEIEKLLQTVRKENKPIIESKSLEQIESEEIKKLMKLIRIKDIVKNSKSLEQIQDEEVNKIINLEKPLRDEIQIVPDRANEYQQIIDEEFANQANKDVTMISSEEVERTVNNDKLDEIDQVEAPTKVSKYSQKEINMEKENVIRMIEKSISDALDRLKNKENKDVDEIFADIYNKKKEEVADKFNQIEKDTGKKVEDIFAEIYLKDRKSIEDIFQETYGSIDSVINNDKKSIEDYFADVYTKTGKSVEEIFADIYETQDRNVEEVINNMYKDNQNTESVDNIFKAIYQNEKQNTREIFKDFEKTTGNSIEEIFADIYGETGKTIDQIFNEIYNTPEGQSNKSIEDRFTEIRISEGKNADEIFQDIYQANKESVEDIFNNSYKPAKFISNLNNPIKYTDLSVDKIKDKVSFEEIFKRAKSANKQNEIHFDYSRATNKDLFKVVKSTSNKSELSEILRVVREKQSEKNDLAKEIELAQKAKTHAVQQKQRANQELLERELRREEAERRVELYLQQLEEENQEDLNKINNYNRDSEKLQHQAEDLLQQAEAEQDKIDEIYETIGQVSLRAA